MTRYLYANQTPNFVSFDENSPKEPVQYKTPEIRVDQEWNPNLIEIMKKNMTGWAPDDGYAFLQTENVQVRSKKLFATIDTEGYMNYFSTRSLRSFSF